MVHIAFENGTSNTHSYSVSIFNLATDLQCRSKFSLLVVFCVVCYGLTERVRERILFQATQTIKDSIEPKVDLFSPKKKHTNRRNKTAHNNQIE